MTCLLTTPEAVCPQAMLHTHHPYLPAMHHRASAAPPPLRRHPATSLPTSVRATHGQNQIAQEARVSVRRRTSSASAPPPMPAPSSLSLVPPSLILTPHSHLACLNEKTDKHSARKRRFHAQQLPPTPAHSHSCAAIDKPEKGEGGAPFRAAPGSGEEGGRVEGVGEERLGHLPRVPVPPAGG